MVSRPFLLPDSVDRLSVSGVDFAKFCLALILSLVFGGSRACAVVVSSPILLPDSVERLSVSGGLIFQNFVTP